MLEGLAAAAVGAIKKAFDIKPPARAGALRAAKREAEKREAVEALYANTPWPTEVSRQVRRRTNLLQDKRLMRRPQRLAMRKARLALMKQAQRRQIAAKH
jgi:hypothetical protein